MSFVGKRDCAERDGSGVQPNPRVRSSNRQVKDRRCVVYRESKAHDATEMRTLQWDHRATVNRALIQGVLNAKTHLGTDRQWLNAEASGLPEGIRRSEGRKPTELGSQPHVQVIPA